MEELRDRLRDRGTSRRSMVVPSAEPAVLEAVEILDEFGAMCEMLYLVMVADRKMLNVEREVCRGALDVVSGGRVRTRHMDAMLDASARNVAKYGEAECFARAVKALRGDPTLAEATVVLAAAVALADGTIVAEEQKLLAELALGLDMAEERAQQLLHDLASGLGED